MKIMIGENSCSKTGRLLLVLGLLVCFLSGNSQRKNCIESYNQKGLWRRYEKLAIGKDILYEAVIIGDSLNKEWSPLMMESIQRSLNKIDSGRPKLNRKDYLIKRIDPTGLAYIANSIGNDTLLSPRSIIIATLLGSDKEDIVCLSYLRRKIFCKGINKYPPGKKIIPKRMHQKIKTRKFKRYAPKKTILLIIRDGQVKKIEL